MSKQPRPEDEEMLPNQAANKEPAEGSRETVEGGGVTNRPSSEEIRSQHEVPPRGTRKEGSHA